MASYLTIASRVAAEIEVKKSRFIAAISPVSTKEEAAAFLSSVRAEHREARHNVYADILREDNYCKFSDDGEPSGTAGKPILEVLRRREIVDICVVVTRYFGGILLGTGGLARAYSESAIKALDSAQLIRMQSAQRLVCRCDYTFYGRIPALSAAHGGGVEQTRFEEQVYLQFYLPSEQVPHFSAALSELSFGKITAETVENTYVPVEE